MLLSISSTSHAGLLHDLESLFHRASPSSPSSSPSSHYSWLPSTTSLTPSSSGQSTPTKESRHQGEPFYASPGERVWRVQGGSSTFA
ncbi:hypothetical protein [Phaffia rhodozyma]|uniref:Uncharacterized protein n=1 Tax=Phaffia rhodozyma TaxID=264483 RepID=A0A0F7SQK1_PHARH|nr:hypothetical protein [Phaffia rhodozyma]